MSQLDNYISIVKERLLKYDIDVPFFIAGGAVYGELNDVDYNDVDVFFYNEESINLIKYELSNEATMVTDNALTFSDDMQFIMCLNGTPEELFATFDISCCMIAYTSENTLIRGTNYSKELNLYNIQHKTALRVLKYLKRSNTKPQSIIYEMTDFLIDNIHSTVKSYYNNAPFSAVNILNIFLQNAPINIITLTEYVHNRLLNIYSGVECINLFKQIPIMYSTKLESPEYYVACCLMYENCSIDKRNIAISKYPEYFI